MNMIFRRAFLTTVGITLLVCAAYAQTYSESKKIVRSFPVNTDTRLDISNKYGKIQVVQWKKDSVRLEVDLSVKSSSMSKLEKIMDNIEIEFTGTTYYITAITRFGSTSNTFLTDLMDLSGAIIPSKNQVEINYTVMAPPNLIVNLSNKFGSIFIDDMNGNVTISLSNGDLKANRITGEADINLNFGNGIINYLDNATLNLSYADFEIRNAGKLSVMSKSSKIRFDKVDILKIESARDKYYISQVSNLIGNGYFTDFRIYKLDKEANFTSKYGDLNIDSVAAEFSILNLHSEYADLDLTFNQESSCFVQINHHPEADVRMPDSFTKIEKTNTSPEEVTLTGRMGNQNSASRLEINAPKKCTITLNQRR